MASEVGPEYSESTVSDVKARLVLQQCLSAELQVCPQSDDTEASFVKIQRGLVIYICFMKEATQELIEKLAKTVLEVRLSRNDAGKLVSIMDLPGDILIVPQATLGGKLKGKVMQYHQNIDKEMGLQLYTTFVDKCHELVGKKSLFTETDCSIKWGTYGNRQVLQMDTNGPFSHVIEL